ncbi:MAG: hypothetical protein HC923_09175 [Myxococcales bacterium]|nr:hypothetical protein [Myxococcales bacterium]
MSETTDRRMQAPWVCRFLTTSFTVAALSCADGNGREGIADLGIGPTDPDSGVLEDMVSDADTGAEDHGGDFDAGRIDAADIGDLPDVDAGPRCPDGAPLQTWYPDPDGDHWGDPSSSVTGCIAPAGYAYNARDNCPLHTNPGQDDSNQDGVGDACEDLTQCSDLVEAPHLEHWTYGSADAAATTLTTLSGAPSGDALRAVTTSAFDFWLRYQPPIPLDLRNREVLHFLVRGTNTTTFGWQGTFPVIVLEDANGQRATLTPMRQLLSDDGVTWTRGTVRISGDEGWILGGDTIDRAQVAAIEVHADTWDFGLRWILRR